MRQLSGKVRLKRPDEIFCTDKRTLLGRTLLSFALNRGLEKITPSGTLLLYMMTVLCRAPAAPMPKRPDG